MGKPAARATDTAMTCNDPSDMPVGQVIAVGTVLINKLPAAKQGDQIVALDTHIIMVPSPGGPVPTPIPHPFVGMIDSGTSTSVNIMGMAAATQDSMASNNPPHIPLGPGPFQKPPTNKGTIKMGSPDVFIGSGSGGGGGGGSGGKSKAKGKSAAVKGEEGHYFKAKFVDKSGKPVTGVGYKLKDPEGGETTGSLAGEVSQAGAKEGDYEVELRAITKVGWSTKSAKVGDTVKLQVETAGVDDGEKAQLIIMKKDFNAADKQIKTIETTVSGNKIEADWKFEVDEKFIESQKEGKKGYSSPSFYFQVKAAGLTERSGILEHKDYIELDFKDEEGNPLANKEFRLFLSNGQVKTGKLDSNGYAKVDGIPPGEVRVFIDPRK